MGLYDLTYYDVIQANAATFGDKICWREVEDGRELSFVDYLQQVDALAGGLARNGVNRGDRLGVVGKNSLEFFLLYGAAARLGAIMLPVNWRLSAEEMCYNLADCSPTVVFVDQEFQNKLLERKSEIPSAATFFNLAADHGEATSFASLLAGGDPPPPAAIAEDGFVIIHTAAVAGRPRGALLSHANVLLANLHLRLAMGVSETTVHLNLLPLFHVAGLFMTTSTFHAGGSSLNVAKFEAKSSASLIEEAGVTTFFDFPPILDSLLKAAQEEGKSLKSLKAVIGLGTPETIATFQQLSGGDYYVMYGQTETSCLASIGKYRDRPGSAGRPIAMGHVRLLDDHDREVAPGQVGEICLKGPMVFKGYWNLPEDNAYAFREGYHHTGDLGRFDADGYLFYAGRKAEKELIKPGGENVYPAEVEKAILQHPAVAATVVFGVPDPKWKEGIKAVCQLKPGMSLTAEELKKFVGSKIASFKKPQYVEFVDSLATKEDGSVDRQAVKERYGS